MSTSGESWVTDASAGGPQLNWEHLPVEDHDLLEDLLSRTENTALLLKPSEDGLGAPKLEYKSIQTLGAVKEWLDEASAVAKVPKSDAQGTLQLLVFHPKEYDSDEYEAFKDVVIEGGPTRAPWEHYVGFAGLSRYRWPRRGPAPPGSGQSLAEDMKADPDQRFIYDLEIQTWLSIATSIFFPESNTTIVALTLYNTDILGFVENFIKIAENDHGRAFRDPRMFQHPLAALVLLISWELANTEWTVNTARQIDDIIQKAGFHRYSNTERKDAREIPSDELSRLTSDAVANSVDIAQTDSILQGLSRTLRFLRAENEEMARFGVFNSDELRHVRYIFDEWAKYLEYRADNLSSYMKGWHHQANAVIQGLQNVVTQKNQDSTLAIALESRKIADDSRRLADESRRLAEASWKDTTSVTAITLITMLFLPATFMATLFSTKFFEDTVHGGDGKRQATTYIATTFPLTVLTVALWYGWVWFRRERGKAILKRRETLEMQKKANESAPWWRQSTPQVFKPVQRTATSRTDRTARTNRTQPAEASGRASLSKSSVSRQTA